MPFVGMKRRLMEEREVQGDKDKKRKANHAVCRKVIATLAPVLVLLHRDLSEPNVCHVPQAVVLSAQTSLEQLRILVAKAKENLASDDPEDWPIGFADGFPAKVGKWVDSASLLAVQLDASKRANAKQCQHFL